MTKKQVYNPYLPSWEYVPDGEPHVFDGRLYVYGSHDRFGGGGYCQNDYVCYSAPVEDLTDWVCHGVIYKKEQDPNRKGEWDLYAPDVTRGADGRYYLYYSAAYSSFISVAVCDTPAGKYEYYGDVCAPDGHVLGTGEKDAYQFDPAVLTDEDGTVYLYSGFKPPLVKHMPGIAVKQEMLGSFVVKLASDMKSAVTEPKPFYKRSLSLGLHNFFEASSIRKFKGIYYFIYSSNFSHELCYATSKYPDRDFTYRGVLYSNGNVGVHGSKKSTYPIGNNHGSIVEVQGKYYVFGHRHTNRDGYTRQGIADPVVMREDGTFCQAEYTSCGLNGGPLQGVGVYPAYIACYLQGKKRGAKNWPYLTQDGADREGDENQYVSDWADGGSVGFKYFSYKKTGAIRLRVRGTGSGTISVLNKPGSRPVGKVDIFIDAQDWTDVSGTLYMPEGISGIYLCYHGTGSIELLEFEVS